MMRRFAIVLGLTAALAAATAAPAAAQTVTPGSYDWGVVDPKKQEPIAEFQLTAGAAPLNGVPTVVSGDSQTFVVLPGFCDGSLNAEQSCTFRVRVNPDPKRPGPTSAVVGVPDGPTATVTAVVPGGPTQGSGKAKKKCKKGKKGKKSAAAAKKKGCKKGKGKGKK